MEHLVRYETAEGELRYEPADTLEAAVSMVERLRNDGNARDAQVFRSVPIEFKAYYKVVVAEGDRAEGAGKPAVNDEPPPGAMPLAPPRPTVQVHDEPTAVDDSGDGNGHDEANRRSSLFSRGG